MAAWVKMVVWVAAMLVPGGWVLLLACAVARAWMARVREASAEGQRDRWLTLRALTRVEFRDVLREARQMASFRYAPARAAH